MTEFQGEVALVTGASGVLGGAVARVLAERGADLVLQCHRNVEAARATAAEVEALGRRALVLEADLGAPELEPGFVAQLTALGPVKRLALAAGASDADAAAFVDSSQLTKLWELNVRGAVLVAQAVLPAMLKARCGAVVALGSEAADHPLGMMGAYAASKAALTTFVRTLAVEVGARGVRANVVSPGLIEGPGMAARVPKAQRDAFLSRTPLGRLVTPREVANAVAFLLSDAQAGGITGQVVSVNGGWS